MRLAHCLVIALAMGMGCSKFDATSEPDDGGTGAVPVDASTDGGPADRSDADAACVMGAMYFDGTKSRIDIAHRPDLDLPDEFTVEAWIRPSAAVLASGAEMHILSHHDFMAKQGWLLAIQSGRIELRLHGTGGTNGVAVAGAGGSPYVEADRWVHVAATRGAQNKLRVFYDGVERSVFTIPTGFKRQASNTDLVIGTSKGNAPTPFQGFIYGVRLTAKAMYSASLDVPLPPMTGVDGTVALFLLVEENGKLAIDSVGNQSNLRRSADLALRKDTDCILP